MKKLTKVTRRFLAVLTAIVTCISIVGSPVYAAETNTSAKALQDEPILTSAGDVIASTAGSFSGGYGSISTYLSRGNWNADIMVGTSGPAISGTVECFVVFPNGNRYNLGTIAASGAHTNLRTFTYCPSGTYTFNFVATTAKTVYVYARIYD